MLKSEDMGWPRFIPNEWIKWKKKLPIHLISLNTIWFAYTICVILKKKNNLCLWFKEMFLYKLSNL